MLLQIVKLREVSHVDLAHVALVCELDQLRYLVVGDRELEVLADLTLDVVDVDVALFAFVEEFVAVFGFFFSAAALGQPPRDDVLGRLEVEGEALGEVDLVAPELFVHVLLGRPVEPEVVQDALELLQRDEARVRLVVVVEGVSQVRHDVSWQRRDRRRVDCDGLSSILLRFHIWTNLKIYFKYFSIWYFKFSTNWMIMYLV